MFHTRRTSKKIFNVCGIFHCRCFHLQLFFCFNNMRWISIVVVSLAAIVAVVGVAAQQQAFSGIRVGLDCSQSPHSQFENLETASETDVQGLGKKVRNKIGRCGELSRYFSSWGGGCLTPPPSSST
eukprot:m.134316 g.134316  ORF g.134316 m.134316 type:complete len:126 (+) comp13112_c9_seq6:552-929(+)